MEGAFHVDEEGVVELAEYFSFIEDGFDVVLLDDSKLCLIYFLFEIYFMAQSRVSSLL